MGHRNRIFSRMAARTGHMLRAASGCVLVLAMSIANASIIGSTPAPPLPVPTAAADASIATLHDPSIIIAAVPADDTLLRSSDTAPSFSRLLPVHRRCYLGGSNPPSRHVLKTERLQAPCNLFALARPSSTITANSFITAANRQRAP